MSVMSSVSCRGRDMAIGFGFTLAVGIVEATLVYMHFWIPSVVFFHVLLFVARIFATIATVFVAAGLCKEALRRGLERQHAVFALGALALDALLEGAVWYVVRRPCRIVRGGKSPLSCLAVGTQAGGRMGAHTGVAFGPAGNRPVCLAPVVARCQHLCVGHRSHRVSIGAVRCDPAHPLHINPTQPSVGCCLGRRLVCPPCPLVVIRRHGKDHQLMPHQRT